MYRCFLILLSLVISSLIPPSIPFTSNSMSFLPHAEAAITSTRRPYGYQYNRYYRYPQSRYANRYNNPLYYNRFNNMSYYTPGYTTSFADLSALEKYVFNKNYSRESDLARLERLEMQAFGAIQNGDINTRYDNVRNAILARPQPTRTKKSLLRTIGNFFSGQMTGFTPSFDTDPFFADSLFNQNPYPSTYGTQSASTYKRPFGGGSRIQNYGTGSTCGVQLID